MLDYKISENEIDNFINAQNKDNIKKHNKGIVKLYYPSMDQDNKPLDQVVSNKIYKQLCAEVCQVSGGLTVTPCQGYFINQSGELIKDDISLISVYTDKLDEIVKIIHENAMLILKSLNQESVMIEVNNSIEFITLKKLTLVMSYSYNKSYYIVGIGKRIYNKM